ncbi:hypothetical protein LTR17_013909 [Elasticomyces elasticus]|nr:hypothetical protein LTR17_013909 [Elasticomyces elasticus]
MQLPAQEHTYPVIIVGGGPVGLSASILFSLRGIRHLLFERRATTSIHPKACGINQRTTEIFRVMGIEHDVYQHAAPPEVAGQTAWYTSFGPDGKEIHTRDAWGGGEYEAEYAAHSPCKYCILPQIRLEPILKRRAEELNPGGIVCGIEVLSVEDHADFGQVVVRADGDASSQTYQARYVLIADGGRMFTDQLGVRWLGERNLFDMVTAHFRAAALRPLHPDPRNFITWFSNPENGGSTRTGYLYQIGPWPRRAPEEEEWVFVCGLTDADPKRFDEATMLKRLKGTIRIPELDVELLSFSHWDVNAIYAETWRTGRIFLVGDSAHRIPPWGALGMNSGIQDAQNLVWKIDLALTHPGKYEALLDTYQTERLEVGRRVGTTSLNNMRSHSNAIDGALGISAAKSAEENQGAAAPYWTPSHPDHDKKHHAVREASRQLDSEFKAPGYEVGWFYPSADINLEGGVTHGGQQRADGELVHGHYFQSTIPGHHLPHVWLEKDRERFAIRDLLALRKLTLFAHRSCDFTGADERTQVVVVAPKAWHDFSRGWEKVRGVDASGGVLARPDGIVAWRGSLVGQDRRSWGALVDPHPD